MRPNLNRSQKEKAQKIDKDVTKRESELVYWREVGKQIWRIGLIMKA